MTRFDQLTPKFIEYIPERPTPGILYISRRYATAVHLCCCGCGVEVVTPLNAAKWKLTETDGTVSLFPSIGNWSFPCRSHYWIQRNRVRWAGAMAPEIIAVVKVRDRRDAVVLASQPDNFHSKLRLMLARAWRKVRKWWRR